MHTSTILLFILQIAFTVSQVQIPRNQRTCGARRVRVIQNSNEFKWALDVAVREVNKNSKIFPSKLMYVPTHVALADMESCKNIDIYFFVLELAQTKCLLAEIQSRTKNCNIVAAPKEYEIICFIDKKTKGTNTNCMVAPMVKKLVNPYAK
uniref:Cystatin domain-containing protein n=1 Tax=Panagrellus redivivus TaxID=6233 RepID=A0A7E4W748_PANRE